MTVRRLAAAAVAAGLLGAGVAGFAHARAGSASAELPPVAESGERGGRTGAEDQAVRRVARRGLRPATDADLLDSAGREDLEDLYGEYHPYFVRGDVDGDGRLDFAQAFVRREGDEPLFDVAVFFGEASGFSAPAWVERRSSLSAGDLTIDRSLVVVTPDLEDDVVRRYRWEERVGAFVDADEGAEDEASPEDPGKRPRATA